MVLFFGVEFLDLDAENRQGGLILGGLILGGGGSPKLSNEINRTRS